jgi:hypothetical protein
MAPPLDLDADATTDDADDADVSTFTRLRVLTFAALGSIVTGYAAVAALFALVVAIAPLAHFSTSGVVVAALPAWLAAHQVPIAISGLELGMLPLLPTIALMVTTARAAAGAAVRLRLSGPAKAGQAVGAIALAHGVCGLVIALAVSHDDASVDPLAALYYPALIAGLAAAIGVTGPCGLWDVLAERADAVALHGVRAGLVAVVLLLAAGGALLTFGLLTSVPTARELFAAGAPGFGSGLGMLLLSVGYVPNAVVASVGFLAGPGFSMGIVTVAPLSFSGGPVPGLPLLAALPEEPAAWWPVLCLLPAGIGVLVGRRLRHVAEDPLARVRAAAVAGGVVALVFVVLAGSAGGRVGMGPFDPVSLRAAAVSVALVAWIGIPAAITAWFGGPRPAGDSGGLLDTEDFEEFEKEFEDTGEPGESGESDDAAEPDTEEPAEEPDEEPDEETAGEPGKAEATDEPDAAKDD